MRSGRTAPWTAHLPRRFRRRPAGRNHQSARHTDPGTDQGNEPQLHGIQVPPDQESSMAEGKYFLGPRVLTPPRNSPNLALRAFKERYYSLPLSTKTPNHQTTEVYYFQTPFILFHHLVFVSLVYLLP